MSLRRIRALVEPFLQREEPEEEEISSDDLMAKRPELFVVPGIEQ